MKKLLVMAGLFLATMASAQTADHKIVPTISVSGQGMVKVIPDQASISVAVVTKGEETIKVKQINDAAIDKVLKYLKTTSIAAKDIKTDRVSLYPQYDYDKKKNYQYASQTITITLRDLSKYDTIMEQLVKNGINTINSVTFSSSELEKYKSQARVLAVADAKNKAQDYLGALGQKLGKAISVSDGSSSYVPTVLRSNMMMAKAEMADTAQYETLAVGELEVSSNVSISFLIE